ncbi:hypothetical protein JCM19238_5222 [Vibrio ponticus]|nr:hypothetical protein JCM19238_5222 [Vibrio ponticus]
MSNELRKQEAAQELVICANQAHTQIETSLDALKARWSALREHYHGLGLKIQRQKSICYWRKVTVC